MSRRLTAHIRRHSRWHHALLVMNLLAVPGFLLLWLIGSSSDLSLASAVARFPFLMALGIAGVAIALDILALAHHIAGPAVYNKR
jgi:hypothetical protein